MPTQSRKRTTRGRGSKLPPIIESSNRSPRKATSQNPYAESTKVNPFRQASRRYSRPSISSETSSQLFSSTSRIPAHRKSVATTIDLSKSETIMKRVEKQRRESMISVLPGRRISFGAIGNKITTLIKAKNAFADLKRRSNVFVEEDETPDETAFEIEKLPHKPRFASTLSAEAQYAMMKGYEDKVYGNLCKEFPEYRSMLRRNRTPMAGGVTVCSKLKKPTKPSKLATNLIHPTTGDQTDGLEAARQTVVTVEQITLEETDDKPASTSTPLPGDEPADRSTLIASPVQQIVHWPKQFQSRKAEKEAYRLAAKSAKEKQLIMTYRYHCAMDILDALRKKQGVHPLSPRMNEKDLGIEPLKDYNSWAYVWNHEFEPNYRPAVQKFHDNI